MATTAAGTAAPTHNTSSHPVDLHDGADLPAAVGTPPGGSSPGAPLPLALILFHDNSPPSQQVDKVLVAVVSTLNTPLIVRIVRVAAASASDLVARFSIDAVPTVLAVVGGGTGGVTVRGRVVGADVPALRTLTDDLVAFGTSATAGDAPAAGAKAVTAPTPEAAPPAAATADSDDGDAALHTRLAALVRRSPVMLFMKGTPDAPRCGFSRQIVALLRAAGMSFGTFDILGDPAVRAGLKAYSQWPTYPQLYVGGEFVGGLDVVKEMAAEAGEGGLAAELGVAA